MRTYWNVGRACQESFAWDLKPTKRNADIIRRLAHDFKRPGRFFYEALKFYRFYPKCPETGLSWSHYILLLKVEDAQKRLMLEQKALKLGINSKDFRAEVFRIHAPERKDALQSKILVARGRLYYYKVLCQENNNLSDGRILVDIGFGIEREAKSTTAESLHSGKIVRAVKEGEDYSVKISSHELDWLYTYKAVVKRTVDGDTLIVRINLGFRTWVTRRLRLRGIDCPEKTTGVGRRATLFVQKIFDASPFAVVKTYKDDKYGRMLADIFYDSKGEHEPEDVVKTGTFLNQELVDKGLAGIWRG